MSLVNELIKGLLPEEEKKQTTAVYAGGFKPPTSGHFKVVKEALEQNPEIDEFIIFIGSKERNGITQTESVLIWEIYNDYLPLKVKIVPTSKPPIQAVYNFSKDHPTREVLWVIGAREGNEEDFKDITSRTKSISKYPNLELRTIITSGGVSGTAARNAAKVSFEKFKKFAPDVLSDDEKYEVYELVSGKVSEGRKKKKDPKKGTGKKPKKSGRRLYTDEDPKDTVGVKFSTRQDIVDTFNKKSFKAKSHARQSQIINLVHQRVRAAYNRAKDPAVKKRLKTALDYAEKRKEASKKKTQRLKKQKTNESIDSSKFDFRPYISSLTQHMADNGLKLDPLPQIQLIHDDYENGEDIFGKTAYYAPQTNIVVLFTYGRHPKDILRSYAHELIHVHQNMEDRLQTINTTDVNADDHLEQLEREAYETGNIMFRSWTDSLTGNKLEEATKKLITEKKKNKDPFGLMAYAHELGRLREEESEYKVYLDMDGVLADFDKRFKDLSGMGPSEFESKYGKNKFWDFIDEEHKVSFWVGIEPMPGAADLINAVKDYNYELLTSPSVKKQSYLGKILWVRNHTGDIFPSKPRINFKKAKEKHEIKPQLSKTDILIDDREDTIGRWNAAGGTGIVYKNISQVLNDLAKLGL
jgi:hypothetical protein